MPQVPLLSPEVTPQNVGLPQANIPVSSDSFGGAVAHALQGLGAGVEQAGDRIWQRAVEMQGLQNETQAKEADAQYMMKAGVMNEAFKQREGLNAGPEALQKHIQDLQDLRVSLRGTLNPAAARMYDGSSLSNMGSYIRLASGYSGTQMKIASNTAAEARKEITKNSIENNPGDDLSFRRGNESIKADNARLAKNKGWAPEVLEAQNENDISDHWYRNIRSLAKTDAFGAQQLFNTAVKDHALIEQHRTDLQNIIDSQIDRQGSRIITDKVLKDRREGEPEEENVPVTHYLDQANKEVDAVPNLTDKQRSSLKDQTRSAVVSKYNQQHAIETDEDNMNVRIIGQALVKANQQGVRPTSVEEAMAIDPAVGGAWEKIARNPQLRQRFLNTFEHNAKQPLIAVNDDNLRITHKALDLANTGTEEQRAEFMAHDWVNETKLTYSQRGRLLDKQEAMKISAQKHVDQDPGVNRALKLLDQQLFNAGISERTAPDDYHAFRGALQTDMIQFQQDNKRMMKPEEIIEMGKNLIKSQPVKAAGWWMTHDTPVYQIPIDEQDKAPVIREYTAKFGKPPPDTTVERIIRAQQYNKYYKPKGGSE